MIELDHEEIPDRDGYYCLRCQYRHACVGCASPVGLRLGPGGWFCIDRDGCERAIALREEAGWPDPMLVSPEHVRAVLDQHKRSP